MKTIIFLDIDGVLNTEQWHLNEGQNAPQDQYGDAFDPEAVANLALIIAETGAEIVLSSTWKCFGLDGIKEMWKDRGLPGKVVGITPNTISDEILLKVNLEEVEAGFLKGYEIKEWLSKDGEQVQNYAIIDDVEGFLPEQKSHLVLVNATFGLRKKDAEKTIKVLNV